jgi:hypothetical protein
MPSTQEAQDWPEPRIDGDGCAMLLTFLEGQRATRARRRG